MPLASKKNTRSERVTPAQLDTDVVPTPEEELEPPKPKVTALVYSYNNAPALRRCLAALEASTNRAQIEILVVDKGSQDESPRLDSEFPNTTFLRLPRNFGNTKALNIAMRTGAAELVFFLAPEIEVRPDTVAQLIGHVENDEQAVAVCPLIVDEAGQAVEQAYSLPSPKNGARLEPQPIATDPAVVTVEFAKFEALLARKYFIRGINYLDERYGEFGAEAELGYQIQRAGRATKVLPQVRVVKTGETPFRESAESMLEADRINGFAAYFGKHYGFVSGLSFRAGQVLGALLGFKFGLFANVVSAAKIDGSQGGLL